MNGTSRVVLGILAVLIVMAGMSGVARAEAGIPEAAAPAAASLPPDVPENWWSDVQKRIVAEEYGVTWQTSGDAGDGAYQAPNRAHDLRTYFTEAGPRVVRRTETDPTWTWGLELVGIGDGAAAPALREIVPNGNRIEYQRGNITEWYVNSDAGLEQGFTIDDPSDALVLDLAVRGDLTPGMMPDGETVEFLSAGGVGIIHYGHLKAYDAAGTELPARLELLGSPDVAIRLVVDTTDAHFPVTIDPLATSAAWTAESNQASASFGGAVSTAGDVNGDGYADVVVGAYKYDNGEVDAGRVYVYHGSASGLRTTAAWIAESNQNGALFGYSVSTAGDVNGDGYADVIVGAQEYNNGEADEGRAFVYHGSASGLGTTAAWTAESNQASARFGGSVSTAGDVNGDGYADVIVGAYGYDNGQTDEGRAYVYHGSATGLSTTAAWIAESNQGGAQFGLSVSTVGDVNGDGYADVIVGAYGYDNGQTDEGRAYVYHGSATGLATTAAWTTESNQASAYFGSSVSTAGDVNGDGYADVIVGAQEYNNGEADEGRAFVYHGSASGLGTTAAWTAESNQASARFGRSVSTAGDVNGDGYADVIVGAYAYDNGQTNEGRAYVYHGSATGLGTTAAWTAESNQAGAQFGYSVSTAGDVNGDGHTDVIVGASLYDNGQTGEGRAFVYYGSPSTLSSTAGWMAESDQNAANLGWSVSTAGDVNGDGYADVVIGAHLYDNGQSDEGRTYVYHGSSAGLSTTANWTAESNQASAHFGNSVSTAGDFNGDGYADVVVSAPFYDNSQANAGQLYLYLGSASGLSSSPAWYAAGTQVLETLGTSVSEAGDVNGDGYGDIIAGAPGHDNGQADEGRVCVYYGMDSFMTGVYPANWTAEGNQASVFFGQSVSTAGDVNGDGYSDIIAGAPFYTNGQVNEGRVFVFHGSASGPSTTANWTAESNLSSGYFGTALSEAGDVNGDGYGDVIIGAPQYDIDGPGAMAPVDAAVVYHGSASGLGASPSWAQWAGTGGVSYGTSVSTAGDVNGDGYSDVIVGAYMYSNGQTNEGRAFVYQGSASGLSTTANWTAESDQASARFGFSVSTAGDVNGDGYADVIISALFYDNGQTDEGRAFVYYGNGEAGRGLSLNPRQRRSNDTAAIAHLGMSESQTAARLAALGRTPFGRGKVKLECEAKPLGTAFNGSGTTQTAAWTNTGTAGVQLNQLVSSLSPTTIYHWRVRLLYNPVTTPYQQRSRWFTMPWNGATEADFRTPGPPLAPTNPGTTAIGTNTITWTWQDNSSTETGFNVYADPGVDPPITLQTTTAANVMSWPHAGLTPNTQYAFQVAATNANGDSAKTTNYATYTLAGSPSIGNNIACDKTLSTLYPASTAFTFSNPAGFGAGTYGGSIYMVSKFKYAWDTNAAYTFTGAESDWNSGTLPLTAPASGSYYLHLQSFNAEGVATATTLDYGPFVIDASAPMAAAGDTPIVNQASPAAQYDFTVLYIDDTAVNASSLDNADIRVTGPNGFNALANFVSSAPGTNADLETATYRITPPGGAWDAADAGVYTISIEADQASDTAGNFAEAGELGGFLVDVTPPSAAITLVTPVITSANTIVYRVTFDEVVAPTFTSADLTSAGSLWGAANITGGPVYTVSIALSNPNADGSVRFNIGTAVTDLAGNPYAGGTSPQCNVWNWLGILFQPTPAQQYSGGTKVLSVTPDCGAGTAIAYQWKWDDGQSKTIHDGPAASTWEITLTPAANGVYWCVMTYDGEPHESDHVTINIADPLSAGTGLGNARQYFGEDQIFAANVSGGFQPLSYVWKKNGGVIDGENGPTYTLPEVDVDDAGAYSVTVTDDFGTTLTAAGSLETAAPLEITEGPQNAQRAAQESHTFSVTATGGFLPLTYVWKHNGNPIDGATEATCTLDALDTDDAGVYRVEVYDDNGSMKVSEPAELTVDGSETVPAGGAAMLGLLAMATALGGAAMLRRGKK